MIGRRSQSYRAVFRGSVGQVRASLRPQAWTIPKGKMKGLISPSKGGLTSPRASAAGSARRRGAGASALQPLPGRQPSRAPSAVRVRSATDADASVPPGEGRPGPRSPKSSWPDSVSTGSSAAEEAEAAAASADAAVDPSMDAWQIPPGVLDQHLPCLPFPPDEILVPGDTKARGVVARRGAGGRAKSPRRPAPSVVDPPTSSLSLLSLSLSPPPPQPPPRFFICTRHAF